MESFVLAIKKHPSKQLNRGIGMRSGSSGMRIAATLARQRATLTRIRHFRRIADDTLWITLSGGFYGWCSREDGRQVACRRQRNLSRVRQRMAKNRHCGRASTEKLSGNLLRGEGFRGTYCDVKAFDGSKRKINNRLLPEVEVATKAENQMVERILPLMRPLSWQDFELLVDLASNSGWRRRQLGGRCRSRSY